LRKFEDLSVREVLALAIHVEQANAERFRTFAGVFGEYDEAVARRFEELAAEEEDHERLLVERFRTQFDGPVPRVDEADVRGVIEAVDVDDAEVLIFDSLEPRRVYELALQAELGAQEFYRRAAATTKDALLRPLFEDLAGMEDAHRSWLEERLAAADDEESDG
jgi:erythrin-vacuolar iron transport family protein